MQSDLGARTLRNLVSPYGLALISFVFFLASWLCPPSFYSSVMRERDILFVNAPTFFFYILCTSGFIFGVWISYSREVPLETPKLSLRISAASFLLLPLLVGLLNTAWALLKTFKESPNLLLLIAAQEAADLKGANSFTTTEQIASTAPTLVAISWWALWRLWQLRLTGWRAHVVRLTIFIAVLTIVGSSIITVSRNLIMETIAGILLLYVLHREAEDRLSWTVAVRISVIFIAGIAILFGAFSFLRGTGSLDAQFHLLLGYSSASYNRLAALVTGSLRYPFSGHGLYLSSFVSFNESFHRLIPLNQILHWPGFFEEWTSEFGAVERAGLDGSLVFLGAFGFVYCDLGWFSPLWLLMYGLAYGLIWKALRSSSVFGIVLYPFFGFCILFWFGTNLLLDSSLVPFLKYSIYLFLYEKLLLRQHLRTA